MNNETVLNFNNNLINCSQSFEKDVSNGHISSKLISLFETETAEIFPNILNISKFEFISYVESKIKFSLIEQYPNDNINIIFTNNSFNTIFDKNMKVLNDKYTLFMKELTDSWDNYKNNLTSKKQKKEELFFCDFRKHCIKTGKFALHKCSNNKYGEYLSVLHKSSTDGSLSIRYLICTKCKKSYFTSLFSNYCKECDVTYYSNKLSSKEKSEFQLATFDPPHCKSLFNKKIKCPKCNNSFLYLNLITKKINCINKKCNYICNIENSNWKCDSCNITFNTNIKIYNPLEIQNVKDAVKLALLIKKKAHPIKMICCNEINVYNSVFFHNKNCNGILYLGELDKNSIIICQKCKAINYYDNFIWTCPSCGKRFKENPNNYKKIKKMKDNQKIFNNNIQEDKKENNNSNQNSKKNSSNLIRTNFNNLNNYDSLNKNEDDNNNNMLFKKKKYEIGRNNNLYEQKTSSNNNNKKKKYILSKYLEMQISLNNKSGDTSKEEKKNSNININENLYKSEKQNHKNYCFLSEHKEISSDFFRHRLQAKNLLKQIDNNINNNNNNDISKDKKVNEKIENINNLKKIMIINNYKDTNYKKPILNQNKKIYFKGISNTASEKGNKSINFGESLNRSKDINLNNSKNNIRSKVSLKKYNSTEDNEEIPKNHVFFYRSQNVLNIRQKYKNSIHIPNDNENMTRNHNDKTIKEYQANSAIKGNYNFNHKKDNNIDKQKRLNHQKIINIFNSNSKLNDNEIEKTKKQFERYHSKDKYIKAVPKSSFRKFNSKDYNKLENKEQIIDSNNERSKESTAECNKNSKKSDISS